ncbi:MAG: DUF952 domain-containing protein [Pseudomonadota bacterium]
MLIYKLFRPAEWVVLESEGQTQGAPIDLNDGYIHFSTAEQVRATAALHFAAEGDLVLVAVDTNALGQDLKWEVSRGGGLFPHLYRALALTDVAWAAPLPRAGDSHVFPDAVGGALA